MRKDDKSPELEIIGVNDQYAVCFIGIANAFKVSKVKIEGHKMTYLGLLSNFNRIKCLSPWRKQHPDLIQVFRDILNQRGYDKDINPTGYLMKKLK